MQPLAVLPRADKLGTGVDSMPVGGNGGEFRKTDWTLSSNVPETTHTKFQDNRTKFRDFGILGGKSFLP